MNLTVKCAEAYKLLIYLPYMQPTIDYWNANYDECHNKVKEDWKVILLQDS